MNNNFEDLKAQIHENEDGESFFILDEGDDFIEMESTEEPIKVCRYENMWDISSDWIKDRIIASSSMVGWGIWMNSILE